MDDLGDVLRPRGHEAGPPRMEEAAAERARQARRGARRHDFRGARGQPGHLRRPEGVPGAQGGGRAHLPQARGAHHARERLGRDDARLREAPEGRGQAGRAAAVRRPRPGEARLQRGRAGQAAVRGHHLREDSPGMALPGRRDERVVEDDRRLVDVGEHGGRARRRRAQDGHSAQEARQGLRAPQRPRVAVRLAAAREDHARGRDRAVDGLDIVALGQRGDGVAHGRHQGRVRARAHLREPRAGGARDLRVHRVLLQQGKDPLGAGIPQPRGVRAGQPARGRSPPEGGVGV